MSARATETTIARSLADEAFAQPRGVPVKIDMRRFPSWPQDKYYVKPPTGAEYAAWEQAGVDFDKRGRPKVKQSPTRKAALIRICVCDANGTLAFDPKHEKQLSAIDSSVLAHWFRASLDAADPAREDEGDVEDEDLLGN